MKKNVDLIVFGQDFEISREYFKKERHFGGQILPTAIDLYSRQ